MWPPSLFSAVDEVHQVVEMVYGGAHDCLLHGDFVPSNIFRLGEGDAPGGLGLIDWELASRHGATVVDYGRFAYYYLCHLESLQTELGTTRDELLGRVFVTREGWLSEVVGRFLAGAFPGAAFEWDTAVQLMRFALLHDLLIQCDHSAHTMQQLGRGCARFYAALGGEQRVATG